MLRSGGGGGVSLLQEGCAHPARLVGGRPRQKRRWANAGPKGGFSYVSWIPVVKLLCLLLIFVICA